MLVLAWFLEHPWLVAAAFLGALFIVQSLHRIGPTEVGLVTKRFAWKKLCKDSPVAFDGEAGYQADLLMARAALENMAVFFSGEIPLGSGARW